MPKRSSSSQTADPESDLPPIMPGAGDFSSLLAGLQTGINNGNTQAYNQSLTARTNAANASQQQFDNNQTTQEANLNLAKFRADQAKNDADDPNATAKDYQASLVPIQAEYDKNQDFLAHLPPDQKAAWAAHYYKVSRGAINPFGSDTDALDAACGGKAPHYNSVTGEMTEAGTGDTLVDTTKADNAKNKWIFNGLPGGAMPSDDPGDTPDASAASATSTTASATPAASPAPSTTVSASLSDILGLSSPSVSQPATIPQGGTSPQPSLGQSGTGPLTTAVLSGTGNTTPAPSPSLSGPLNTASLSGGASSGLSPANNGPLTPAVLNGGAPVAPPPMLGTSPGPLSQSVLNNPLPANPGFIDPSIFNPISAQSGVSAPGGIIGIAPGSPFQFNSPFPSQAPPPVLDNSVFGPVSPNPALAGSAANAPAVSPVPSQAGAGAATAPVTSAAPAVTASATSSTVLAATTGASPPAATPVNATTTPPPDPTLPPELQGVDPAKNPRVAAFEAYLKTGVKPPLPDGMDADDWSNAIDFYQKRKAIGEDGSGKDVDGDVLDPLGLGGDKPTPLSTPGAWSPPPVPGAPPVDSKDPHNFKSLFTMDSSYVSPNDLNLLKLNQGTQAIQVSMQKQWATVPTQLAAAAKLTDINLQGKLVAGINAQYGSNFLVPGSTLANGKTVPMLPADPTLVAKEADDEFNHQYKIAAQTWQQKYQSGLLALGQGRLTQQTHFQDGELSNSANKTTAQIKFDYDKLNATAGGPDASGGGKQFVAAQNSARAALASVTNAENQAAANGQTPEQIAASPDLKNLRNIASQAVNYAQSLQGGTPGSAHNPGSTAPSGNALMDSYVQTSKSRSGAAIGGPLGCARTAVSYYNDLGIPVPQTQSAGGFEKALPSMGWSQIPAQQAGPNDVVMMPGTGPSGRHVGVYAGAGQMLNDPGNSSGGKVVYSQVPRNGAVFYRHTGSAPTVGGNQNLSNLMAATQYRARRRANQ